MIKASVLFVCMANICRSPAAEGVLKHMAKNYADIELKVDSCGVGDWNIGAAPDSRIQESAKARGIYLTGKAKQFHPFYFEEFDYILAADKDVRAILYQYAKTTEQKAKIGFITDYSSAFKGEAVPDPYYQAGGAFERVLDIIEDSCAGLLDHIRKQADLA